MPRRSVELRPDETATIRAKAKRSTRGTAASPATESQPRVLPSWLLAVPMIPLIGIAAIMDALVWPRYPSLLRLDGSWIDDPARIDAVLSFATVEFVAVAIALALWCAWAGACLANLPALTGRWPGSGWSEAFLAPIDPRIWRSRPLVVVREIMDGLTGQRTAPALLVSAWWVMWLAAYLVPAFLMVLRRLGGANTREMFEMMALRPVFFVPAGVFAIAIVVLVEWTQLRARDRQALATRRASAPCSRL